MTKRQRKIFFLLKQFDENDTIELYHFAIKLLGLSVGSRVSLRVM